MMINATKFIPFLLLLLPATATSQKTMFTYLQEQQDLKITLITNWDTLFSSKDNSYYDAEMVLGDSTWNVELRVRGKYRRRYCDVLPIMIKFKKKHLRNFGVEMDDFNNIKVVTHCLNDEEGLQNVYEEYLIYKLFGMITPESYKVLLCDIVYAWPDEARESTTSQAVLIEPNDEISWRLDGIEVEKYNLSADSLHVANYNRVALFEFMVGNVDWDHTLMRNLKILQREKDHIIVPYDFDFSAIVYPSYGRLSSALPMEDFRDRFYLGRFFYEALPETEEEFLAKKEDLLNYVMEFPYLEKARCRQIASYIKKFYKFIEDPENNLAYGTVLRK
jgi:hypothetical protein